MSLTNYGVGDIYYEERAMENFRPEKVGPNVRLVTSVSSAWGYMALPYPQTPASMRLAFL